MNKLIVGLIVVVILAGGWWLWSGSTEGNIGMADGVVMEVDREGAAVDGPVLITLEADNGDEHLIAIPSMGLPLCAAFENIADPFLIEPGDKVSVFGDFNDEGGLIEGGYIMPCESVEHYLRAHVLFEDEKTGLSFEYRRGPNGYLLQDLPFDPAPSFPDPEFVKGYQLILSEDYEELQTSEGPREGPPTITVSIFENTENQSASMWVDNNSTFSNIELAVGEVDRDAILGGANAVRYMADGLYRNDNVVVAHGGYIFMFSGAFLVEESIIRQDFEPFLNSIDFVQAEGQE